MPNRFKSLVIYIIIYLRKIADEYKTTTVNTMKNAKLRWVIMLNNFPKLLILFSYLFSAVFRTI